MRTLVAAALAGLVLAGQCLAADPTPEERYDAALAMLKAHCGDLCGLGLENNPTDLKALDTLWNATQDWTIAFLASHPSITIEKLNTELLNRHPMNIDAARVAPERARELAENLYAFSTSWVETGDIFLVSKREGRWAVVWDIRNAKTGRLNALKAWRTDHNSGACHDDVGPFQCGPLWGGAFPLKPDAQGRVRFGITATYAQGGGFTVMSQISFWRWDGVNAEPLMAQNYFHELDDISSNRDATDTVTVRVKDEYKTVLACGACVGRQLDWTFRILPDRIVDEGKRPLYPEADFIDALYARVRDHRPVTGTGTPAALTLMAENIPDGMGDFAVRGSSSGVNTCLSSDGFEGFFLRYHVVRRKGGYFIDKAERWPEDAFSKLCYPTAK